MSENGSGGSRVAIFAALGGCGCLIAIVLLGFFAAIFIPNFVDALQQAKQKQTLRDMNVYAVALTDFYGENGAYPSATSIEELAALLDQPTIVTTDSWENPLRYLCQPSPQNCQDFRLVAAGSDGMFDETDPFIVTLGPIDDFEYESDIVLGPDGFLSAPR